MTFADSTIRKVIFPYPEDAGYEDPDRPPHWLANIRYQALGLEGRRCESSRHRPSHSADYHEALWTSFGGTDDESSGEGEDSIVNSAAARESCGVNLVEVPKFEPLLTTPEGSGTRAMDSSRPTLAPQSRSRSSQPQLSHGDKVTKDRSTGRPTASEDHPKGKSEARRHHRHHSLPTPLTPAQPLVQVNTFLPLRIPPPDLRAKSPLAYPVGFYFADQHTEEAATVGSSQQQAKVKTRRRMHRRDRSAPSRSTRTSVNSLLDGRGRPSSSSSSSSEGKASLVSVESDGSFHGDAGDEDPESQLAAGIAKLKREQQMPTQPPATSVSKVERHNTVPAVNELDDDLMTAREIEEHAGLMTSLADLVLGLKVTRTGEAFRHRSASYTDVQDLRDCATRAAHSNNVHLSRTQSADALEDSWANAKRPNPAASTNSSLFSSGVSTPYELRDEVVRWSRRRRDAAVRGSRSSRTSPPSYTSTLLDYIPFASALMNRLAQLQSITAIAEVSEDGDLTGSGLGEDNKDDEQVIDHEHAATLARAASEPFTADEDDEDATPPLTTTQDDAFSSLWASPITSRASSHYNLKILTDEPSAFEEHSTESSVGAWRSRYIDPSSLRFTRMNGQGAGMDVNRNSKSISHGVSPLWAENHIDDEDESRDGLDSSTPAYTRSWSSVLGMAA